MHQGFYHVVLHTMGSLKKTSGSCKTINLCEFYDLFGIGFRITADP